MDISKMDLNNLALSRAELSDYEAILGISEGVYEGHDYLPNCYRAWLEEERRNPDKILNVVLVQAGDPGRQILGFKAYRFMV